MGENSSRLDTEHGTSLTNSSTTVTDVRRHLDAASTWIFLKGDGQAQGNAIQMESLCTESPGGLAVLIFLIRYIAYHSITPQTDAVLHYSDNKVLIERINW
eukprot:1886516-Ditylum_brightwellii.AAC.1